MTTIAEGFTAGRLQLVPRLTDYAQLTKLRVTTLIVMTAWCGYFFGSEKAGTSSLNWGLFHALLGIALVSSGTAALNEVLERDLDRKMRRTASRPYTRRPHECAACHDYWKLAYCRGFLLSGFVY